MGKGDRKTRRGKIFRGSRGKHRMAKSTAAYIPQPVNTEKSEEIITITSAIIADAPAKAVVERKTVKKPAADKKAKPSVPKKETKPVAKAPKAAEKKAKA